MERLVQFFQMVPDSPKFIYLVKYYKEENS
ncbi:hypothetical protein C7M33_01610 [Lactiplantibacillus plantarum]|nr:hypothetical protein S100434_02691 [Lactiplantibacillus plantarum subsp. plantarum]QHM22137.1 hypothetical protein C7M31_01610 [Lactiplantibacillus plantarum]QHM24924.1 hypothetical protein C7M32_01445 [Lactiplantibacillus plantarum]QHM28051.1 hypothetical protein C7M33_01610 [Lactiplantibacillus plantarum]WAU31171.1 hypothetical protein OR568_02813 [Lactiplantibacillus plantarum]